MHVYINLTLAYTFAFFTHDIIMKKVSSTPVCTEIRDTIYISHILETLEILL